MIAPRQRPAFFLSVRVFSEKFQGLPAQEESHSMQGVCLPFTSLTPSAAVRRPEPHPQSGLNT